MRFSHGTVASATFALAHAASIPRAYADTGVSPIVRTSYGPVQGAESEYRDGVSAFKGIPYAAPPVGDQRWKAPTKPQAWGTAVLNATAAGPQCPQLLDLGKGLWTTGSNVMSEDCLYLNVWTPSAAINSTEKLPVYVWYYGGRFLDGSGDVVTYDGSGLAAEDIVVVTLNYRIGAFGFFAHPDLAAEDAHGSSGNYGVLDMIFALEWVHAEIENFGGDPSKVTVGGQSSGSSCALDMFYSPQSSGLINGLIAESGPRAPHDPLTGSLATSYRTKAHAEELGEQFMADCNATTIAEMRNISATVLTSFDRLNDTIFIGTQYENVTNFMEAPAWRPVEDDYVLPSVNGEPLYGGSLRYNTHAQVPVLAGNNLDESGAAVAATFTTMSDYEGNFTSMLGNLSSEYFELYPSSTLNESNAANNLFWQDTSRVSTWKWAKDLYAGGATGPVYSYFWTHAPPSQALGAFHGSEMYYVFNNIPYAYPDMNWTATDLEIQDTMVAYWANFIKMGDPNGGNLTSWTPSGDELETMWLGDGFGMGTIGEESHVELIEEWFAQSGEY